MAELRAYKDYVTKHVIVLDDVSYNRYILNQLGCIFTVVPHISGSVALGYVSTNKIKRIAKTPKDSVVPSGNSNTLYVFADTSRRSRNKLCDELDAHNIYWTVKSISTECFASDYDEISFETYDELATSIYQSYQSSVDTLLEEDSNVIHKLKEHLILPTKDTPLHIVVNNVIGTRYNGGSVSFRLAYELNGKLTELSADSSIFDDIEYAACEDINDNICATIVPFTLPMILMAVFGKELSFQGDRTTINMFNEGALSLIFNLENTIGKEREIINFNDVLEAELHRWFNDPAMTFEKFIKHASMFMMPSDTDDTTS